MPLRKFNKIIASHVTKNFKIENNLVFKIIFDHLNLKKKFTIDDLGFLIGPILNSGGRLGFSDFGTQLLTSDDLNIIKKKTTQLINLNNKRKKIEDNILKEINFKKISDENKNVIIYYNNNIHEGLIGIIASRLKDFFNKPSIVLTKSNKILKASARSTKDYNLGKIIRLLIDKKIIENGGGHNLAAGFSIKESNINFLDDFLQKDYLKINKNFDLPLNYDAELPALAVNKNLYNEISKLGPFGSENILPIFLIRDVKILKSTLIDESHINTLIKPKLGSTINAICFNCANTKIGEYLLSYKEQINLTAQITENSHHRKNSVQLIIKDLFLSIN